MADLARGTVVDRPWGRTLAALGLRGVTGQLTVIADAKPYRIAFSQGAVVAASSPLGSDAAVRVALTGHLISSTQVAEISRKQAAAPSRDEVEVIAELARLAPEQAMRLRRRVIAQRAARTFALERGDFLVRDEVELAVVPGSELDIRTVIYLGAKQLLSEARLNTDLASYGQWFQIRSEAMEDLPQYGFGEDERPYVEALLAGASLGDMERPGADVRMVRAVTYALVSCNAALAEAQPRPGSKSQPPRTKEASGPIGTPTPASSPRLRVPTPTSNPRIPTPASSPRIPTPASSPRIPTPTSSPRISVPTPPEGTARPGTPTAPMAATDSAPIPQPIRTKESTTPTAGPATAGAPTREKPTSAPPRVARPTAKPSGNAIPSNRSVDTKQTADVQVLIEQRLTILNSKGDHFALLGVPRDATQGQIRDGYFAIARQLHPDRLSALGIPDENRRAQRLFAEVNAAFATLSDPLRRERYLEVLSRGGEAAIKAEQQKAEEMAMRILESEEAFRRGEMALRRDSLATAIRELEHAIQLNPDEPDYHATLAWAKFAAAPDKLAVATATRAALESAIRRSPKAITARFFLGRVERMLGKDPQALVLFQEVLRMEPGHADATAEIRVLEQRLGSDKGGLFGRIKR